MLRVSCDQNANLKILRRLELEGLVELFAVAIEGLESTKKIKHKELPMAVIGSKFSTIGNCVMGAEDNSYSVLQSIVGRNNHADVLHLERHISSGRDVFVTEDTDFLNCRAELRTRLGVRVMTPDELKAFLIR